MKNSDNAESILITGGAGFIGSNFAHKWLANCEGRLINVDKLTYAGNLHNLAGAIDNDAHVFVKGDIGDRELIAELLQRHRPRAVINFAAESHVDRSIHGPSEFIQTNVVGTYQLLEAARAYWGELDPGSKDSFRFVHVSTDEVYGSLSQGANPFTETHPYEPNSGAASAEPMAVARGERPTVCRP